MPRNSTCLYCGDRANSKEHLFPAALGGRLTKKILCAECNSRVSVLDQELSSQLLLINSLLGVQGRDNKDIIGEVRDNKGMRLRVDKYGRVENSDCEVKTVEQATDETIFTVTGSQRAIDKYMMNLRKEGKVFKVNERRQLIEYRTQPVTIPLAIGKPAGLKEIARIALNFFEYFHSDLARGAGVAGLKKFILDPDTEAATFPDGYIMPKFIPHNQSIPNNPFAFGHRIIICLDSHINRAYAFVSFFSCVEFVIDLGNPDSAQSFLNIIDINPLGKSMSNHIFIHPAMNAQINIDEPIAIIADFNQDQYLDELEIRMQSLYAKVDEQHIENTIISLYETLANFQTPLRQTEINIIANLVTERRQTVLFLMGRLCSSLENLVRKNPRTAHWAHIFQEFVKPEEENPKGISTLTEIAIERINERFILAICKQIQDNTLTRDWLRSLCTLHHHTSGELIGAMLCKEVIFNILKEIIGRDKFLRMMAVAMNMEGY